MYNFDTENPKLIQTCDLSSCLFVFYLLKRFMMYNHFPPKDSSYLLLKKEWQ